MPKAYVHPIEAWYPTSMNVADLEDAPSRQFTLCFMDMIPGIMVEAMERAFGEDVDLGTVVPRLREPERYVREGITPDLEFTASPNWSPARWANRDAFRRELYEAISEAMYGVRNGYFGNDFKYPQVDIDVDFVMGPGCAMDRNRRPTASWPDKLDLASGL